MQLLPRRRHRISRDLLCPCADIHRDRSDPRRLELRNRLHVSGIWLGLSDMATTCPEVWQTSSILVYSTWKHGQFSHNIS